jgi:hypothetical protein
MPSNCVEERHGGRAAVTVTTPFLTTIGDGKEIMGVVETKSDGQPVTQREDSLVPGQDKTLQSHPEMEDYRRLVNECAVAADGRVIFNRSPTHAAVVIENLFRVTEKEVDILTGHLFEPVFATQSLIDSAVSFLSNHKDSRLKIIHDDPIEPLHPFLAAISAAKLMERVDIRPMTPELKEATPYHFAVGDARHFRFEPSKKTFEAVAQFGEPEVGGKLKVRFDHLYSSLSPK